MWVTLTEMAWFSRAIFKKTRKTSQAFHVAKLSCSGNVRCTKQEPQALERKSDPLEMPPVNNAHQLSLPGQCHQHIPTACAGGQCDFQVYTPKER